ncbi:hypothetical protein DPMN_115191 [Dreissena polymorpha]|uniref:Uncharacterized protein n=1 Tax=Dreissena polymorpha TaxID=45954 RepID=A0A9D4KKR6_DREPO|nr:hypothetical protein DPMN_115191 [Dreissena polymorpha]
MIIIILTSDRNVLVGPHPKHLRYTDDCDTVVVSNEGIAGKDSAGNYVNPEGSITIIHREKTANRSARMVDFHSYNIGQPNFKYII